MTNTKGPQAVSAVMQQLRGKGGAPRALTNAERKFLENSTLIQGAAADAKDAAYLARELVQASLPHSNPGDIPLWTRRNGDVTLAIQPGINIRTGKSYGYPYGTIPRLLLFWITTEAVRIRSRRLELGHSLNGFMADLGLNPDTGGGKRGDAKRLRDQMERLFRSRFSLECYEVQDGQAGNGWIDVETDKTSRLKADVLVTQIGQCAKKQACATKQEYSERYLKANRNLAESLRGSRRGSTVLSQGLGQPGTKELQGGSRTEQESHQNGEPEGKQENAKIDGRRVGRLRRIIATGVDPNQCIGNQGRKQDSRDRSACAEHGAFNQQLRNDSRSRRSQCIPHRNLANPTCGPQE